MAKNIWTTLSIHPLAGGLDTRSRPADIPVAWFRWKEMFQSTNAEKVFCRRAGFQRFFSDRLFDDEGVSLSDPSHGVGSNYHNHDHHHQGAERLPFTFLFESTASDGTRRFFDGNEKRVSVLNEDDGSYTDILTVTGAPGKIFKGAELQDVLILCNDNDGIWYHDLASTTSAHISDLNARGVTQAKLTIQFNGFIFLLNVVQDGARESSRVWWSDINAPTSFPPDGTPDSLSGWQDLDYGDDILTAGVLLGSLYIFTKRSIWKCSIGSQSGTDPDVFTFSRVYNEPKNQAGCLSYGNTLVSDGSNFWYMSRDGVYNYNPYIAAPERQDWLHRADGYLYQTLDDQFCQSPVAEYRPAERELWFSWATVGLDGINNWTMIASTEQKTADYMPVGFTAFVNYRRNPTIEGQCNETQDFVGACGLDWCHKSLGSVYYFDYAQIDASGDRSVDLPLDDEPYVQLGYNSYARGLIPTGLFDRDKLVRNVFVSDDSAAQEKPCLLRVRIGNAYQNVDPNSTAQKCSPLWRIIRFKAGQTDAKLECSNALTIATMKARNLRPNLGKDFKCYEEGRYLYYEISIINWDGGLAIGGDCCFQEISFDVAAKLKA